MHKLSSLEFYLLAALALVLPLFEVPKTLLCLFFFITWLVRALTGAGWGGQWRIWDTVFGGMIGVAFITVWAATPLPQQWREAVDVTRWVLLGWLLSRSVLSPQQVHRLLAGILTGTLLAGAYGMWVWWVDPARSTLQLNSVGHVNHSAIYLAITALAAIGGLLAWWPNRRQSGARTACWLLALAAGALALLVLIGDSRGAMLAFLAGILVLAVGARRHSGIHPVKPIMILLLFLGAVLFMHPSIVQKTIVLSQSGNPQSYRTELARVAIEAWRMHPITGVGPANFGQVTQPVVEAWVRQRGEVFTPSRYLFMAHAHSLYFNTLAERGALGVIVLLLLLAIWVRALLRRPAPGQTDEWVRWSGAVAAGTVVVVAGLFNTTLHHEHGLLAMLLLGPWIGPRATGDADLAKAPSALL